MTLASEQEICLVLIRYLILFIPSAISVFLLLCYVSSTMGSCKMEDIGVVRKGSCNKKRLKEKTVQNEDLGILFEKSPRPLDKISAAFQSKCYLITL